MDKATSIGEYCFNGCDALTDIYVAPSTPPSAKVNIFDDSTYTSANLHVKKSGEQKYKATSPWSKFFTVIPDIDEATSIDYINIDSNLDNADIYDLGGRKQDELQRGVNIVNGKKVLVQ